MPVIEINGNRVCDGEDRCAKIKMGFVMKNEADFSISWVNQIHGVFPHPTTAMKSWTGLFIYLDSETDKSMREMMAGKNLKTRWD